MSDICEGCKKPIHNGEARYNNLRHERYWHWDCYQAALKPISNDELDKVGKKIDRLITLLKAGI